MLQRIAENNNLNVDLYSTKYNLYWEAIKKKPDLIIVPWYSNGKGKERYFKQLKFDLNSIIINSHQEQIPINLTKDFVYGQRNNTIDYHFCWGRGFAEGLVDRNISTPSQNFITGSSRMDIAKLSNGNKGELAKRSKLSKNKNWILFTSNFSPADFNEAQIYDLKRKNIDGKLLVEKTGQARSKWKEWITDLAREYKNEEIIIRPHPGENHKFYKNLLDEYKGENIYVISELPVNKWISVSDVVLSWSSTSMIESWVIGKPTFGLKLTEFPYELKGEYFNGVDWVKSSNELINKVRLALNNQYSLSGSIEKRRSEFLKKFYNSVDLLSVFKEMAVIHSLVSQSSFKKKSFHFSLMYLKEMFRNLILNFSLLTNLNIKNQLKTKKDWEKSEDYFSADEITIEKHPELKEYIKNNIKLIDKIHKGEYDFIQKKYGIEISFL